MSPGTGAESRFSDISQGGERALVFLLPTAVFRYTSAKIRSRGGFFLETGPPNVFVFMCSCVFGCGQPSPFVNLLFVNLLLHMKELCDFLRASTISYVCMYVAISPAPLPISCLHTNRGGDDDGDDGDGGW